MRRKARVSSKRRWRKEIGRRRAKARCSLRTQYIMGAIEQEKGGQNNELLRKTDGKGFHLQIETHRHREGERLGIERRHAWRRAPEMKEKHKEKKKREENEEEERNCTSAQCCNKMLKSLLGQRPYDSRGARGARRIDLLADLLLSSLYLLWGA